ncbi:Ig domain-containing protein group 1 domain-containing protein [Salinigranum rubrum]|uniref:Ig domain-containing protein group 1 domain-containing protein n=1 Tax=Salinigranum rubrum TaxID=755307 RepID=A0A2I8VPJ3_9EURY|nr:Ig domain-containing protein group 1 domain-containing protein [Salinigranum rubrum]
MSRFCRDERAIEGLPVRLVVALVVGVASLSLMLNMLTGVEGLAVAELDVRPEKDVITPGSHELDLVVVDPDGDPVPGATAVVKSGSASLAEGVVTAETGDRGVASVSIEPSLLAHQQDGTVVVDVKPPAGSQYVDRRGNTEILVVRGAGE